MKRFLCIRLRSPDTRRVYAVRRSVEDTTRVDDVCDLVDNVRGRMDAVRISNRIDITQASNDIVDVPHEPCMHVE